MKKKAVIGIDVGGTSVSIGVITEQAEILEVIKYPQIYTNSGIWLAQLIEELWKLKNKISKDIDIIAIGIGARGHVDFKSQRLISSSVMEVLDGFELCQDLQYEFGIPVYIDNDVKAAASRELLFGAGKKYKDFICYNVGTGIAVAAIQDGRLIRGKNNNAGEIGYDLLLKPEPGTEYKGLEALASGQGFSTLTNHYKNAQEVFEACCRHESEAEAITETALYVLSASVINISHLLDPEIFVFTGGVASDSWFFERLKNKVSELSELLKEKEIPKMMISDFAGKQNGPYGPAGVAFYGVLRSNYKKSEENKY